jgi:hypothetical protein
MNKQGNKLSGRNAGAILLAFLPFLASVSEGHGQEGSPVEVFEGGDVSLAGLSGERIDRNWFRYVNGRFGMAVDIPAHGYRYTLPVNGSGLTLRSDDEQVTITLYAHWVANPFPHADNNVEASIKHFFDADIAQTKANEGTITYSVRKKQFYVVSGHFGENTFYERMTISPRCPAIFNSVRIFSPKARGREIDNLVTRMSLSLRATCRGEEGAAKF